MSIFFPIFIIVISSILFLVHYIVYKSILAMLTATTPQVDQIIKYFMIIFGGGFVVSMLLASQYYNIATRVFYTLTASWYVFLFYFFIASILYTLVMVILRGYMSETVTLWMGRVFIIIPLCIGIYGLWNAEQIQTTRYVLPLNAPQWSGKRIVFLSDTHLGQVHGAGYSQKITDKINELKPGMVLIGGDMYDGVKVPERDIILPFTNIIAEKGTYFVTGNHEEFSDRGRFVEAVKSVGIRVLANEKVIIDGLALIGMNDSDSTDPEIFEEFLALTRIGPDIPTILLKHQPFQLDIAEKYSIDVQMSGHTHRAQLYPLSYITRAIYKGYDYGYKQYGAMRVYTTSGVGTWGPPGRVGTNSEIVVFDIQ